MHTCHYVMGHRDEYDPEFLLGMREIAGDKEWGIPPYIAEKIYFMTAWQEGCLFDKNLGAFATPMTWFVFKGDTIVQVVKPFMFLQLFGQAGLQVMQPENDFLKKAEYMSGAEWFLENFAARMADTGYNIEAASPEERIAAGSWFITDMVTRFTAFLNGEKLDDHVHAQEVAVTTTDYGENHVFADDKAGLMVVSKSIEGKTATHDFPVSVQ